MIESMNSMSVRPPPPPSANSAKSLSEDDASLISETLANYDADNLSQADAAEIVDTFSQAGINPSMAFAEALADSGFDAKNLGDLAGVGKGNRPPPPDSGNQATSSSVALSSIVDYLDELQESDTTSDSSLASSLSEKFGLAQGQSLIDVTA